jgi:hypothetical protein
MKKLIIEDSKKHSILKMNKSLMKEQTSDSSATNSDADLQKLRNLISVGCLSDGSLKRRESTGEVFYRKQSVKQPSKQIDFYANMTYKFTDGSKSGKWICPELSGLETSQAAAQQTAQQTASDIESKIATEEKKGWKKLETLKAEGVDLTTLNQVFDKQVIGNVALFRPKGDVSTFTSNTSIAQFNQDQLDFIDRFTQKGYKLNPTRIEQMNLVKVTGEQLGAPSDLFPNGLVMWYDANQQSSIGGREDSVVSDILDNQSINRNACRKNIEDFYELYRRRNSAQVDPSTIDRARRVVQACKDEHYGRWGIIGGNKFDDILDLLSGSKQGGPGTQGPSSIFRIK